MKMEMDESASAGRTGEKALPSAQPAFVSFELQLPEAADTQELGAKLAQSVEGNVFLAMVGPLGAGKTTFAQGVGLGLGVEEIVNSPTFTMLNEYTSGRLPFYHLDLYRIGETSGCAENQAEASLEYLCAELDELSAGSGVVLVEWADFLKTYVSEKDYVLVELNYMDKGTAAGGQFLESGRVARLTARGPRSSAIVEAVRNVYFS